MTTLQPIAATERHTLLDILRGFALLGVLLANMASHSGYFFLIEAGHTPLETAKADHIVEWIEAFLIDGKFYSLFSMLFGIGFALQLKRASELDINFVSRFRRRLLIMFAFGLLHAILLFVGDILTVYALTGFVLILFRNSTDKFLLRSAFIFTLLPVVQYTVLWIIHLSSSTPPDAAGGFDQNFFDQLIQTYRSGDFAEIIKMNTGGLIMGRYPDLIFTGRFFRVLAMFLVGFYVAKNLLYTNLEANRPFIRKVMSWGAVIGFPCNIGLAMIMTTSAYYDFEPLGIIQPVVYAFGVPALCLFYMAGITLWFMKPEGKKRLMIFAPVGQLALTNYLMQSLICVFIFTGYGLGLIATIGPSQLVIIGFIIYIAQLIFSHLWVKYFRFGPMEWLWRSLTYGKLQPMKMKS